MRLFWRHLRTTVLPEQILQTNSRRTATVPGFRDRSSFPLQKQDHQTSSVVLCITTLYRTNPAASEICYHATRQLQRIDKGDVTQGKPHEPENGTKEQPSQDYTANTHRTIKPLQNIQLLAQAEHTPNGNQTEDGRCRPPDSLRLDLWRQLIWYSTGKQTGTPNIPIGSVTSTPQPALQRFWGNEKAG